MTQDTTQNTARRPADTPGEPDVGGRSARKRRAIIEAATELFLAGGYDRTSMDEIATLARVSKQTVYKQFSDKPQLFAEVVVATTARAGEFVTALSALDAADDLPTALRALARRYIATVMQPRGLQLRRMVIGAGEQFASLAASYYERAPGLTLDHLATAFERLAERGLLHVDDADAAAAHFAYMVLGRSLDQAMFLGESFRPTRAELERRADGATSAFLRAYGTASARTEPAH